MTELRIHCWRNEYRVPAFVSGGSAAAHDLDRLAQRLAEALADQADGLPGLEDDGVLLLRELSVDCDIGLDCGADQVLRHWSRRIAAALAEAIENGHVLRFPSLAAYRARFIADLLAGRAWTSWMYPGFEGLRVLPPGAVIRTLLAPDAEAGCATLSLLDAPAWPLLFSVLPVREALRILSPWREAEDRDGSPAVDERMLGWAASSPVLPGAHPPPLTALWLLAAWRRAGIQDPMPVGAACWTAALLAMPGELGTARLHGLAHRADDAAMRAVARGCGDPDWLLLLATSSRAEREAAAGMAMTLRTAQEVPPAASQNAPEVLDAPSAGLAWLLPALLELLQGPVLPALPPAAEGTPLDLATACALALAAGPRGEQAWCDRFWRAFLRLPERGAHLDEWLQSHDPAPAWAALALVLRTRSRGTPVLLRYREAGASRLLAVLRESACRLGTAAAGEIGTSLPFGERLALTRLLRHDDAWLAMSPALARLPPAWREFFATLAQAALRRTAYRIPGVARCSLPYLFANVLGVGGQAHATGLEAWSCTPQRPPLHVLLSVNGMSRLRLDWPGGRRLALQCAE